MAKEIMAEVFHAQPGEVEEMIWSRQEESVAEGAKKGNGRIGTANIGSTWGN